ncbi:MAG: ion transporter [Deltaproteobacteria bacterium]|nr:ion transporter [Deltaproteobacteria bacterium]
MTDALPEAAAGLPDLLPYRICRTVYSGNMQRVVMIVIIANSVILGLETSAAVAARFGALLELLDRLCLAVFCIELAMKIVCERLAFFRSSWNLFDFLIVGISVAPGAGKYSVLRALRILRAMRLITKLHHLRMIVESIIRSLPSIAWISILLLIVFYIFAVLSTTLFGHRFPEWFGTLGASMFSLFQILTLDSWSMGIVRPVMAVYPYSYLVFVPFILSSSFVVLNVFIGVIVNAIAEVASERGAEVRAEVEAEIQAEFHEEIQAGIHEEIKAGLGILRPADGATVIVALREEFDSLKAQLDRIERLMESCGR